MNRTEYSVNEKYLLKNGQPWFPMMGEMHFTRYPRQYWKESLYKMKAGGIEIVSTYVFWLHHEEIEKEYDFTGQRDLRAFVETVKDCGMTLFLRVGPWCHGEARNGGMPDWLLKKEYKVRTNNEEYFEEVTRYYKKVAEQVEGLYHKDDGPIIGLQIENEYGHCGGLQGEEGEEHMRRLTAIAKDAGMIVPYYTATGWGGAVTGGLIPVMGGYCEAPWDQRLTEIEPSGNYIFTQERNDHNIGSDYGFGTGITFDITKHPFLTAELGGGLQVTHHRRPVAYPKDIGAMSMVKLGCGVNLLGYYMYHGGTNPEGKLTTLQESRATGYPNDLPIYSYDFSAPIREYGQMSGTLKEIKLLSMFVKDFGSALCEMKTDIPKTNPLYQTNLSDLRTSVRRNGNRGYLFVNNYQRRYQMADHMGELLKVELENEVISYPERNIKNGDFFFLPFNMRVGDGELKSAMATPLCILKEEKETYVFYTNQEPKYDWVKEPVHTKVLTLSREDALNSWIVSLDKEYLVITAGEVIACDTGYEILNRNREGLKSYPKLPAEPVGYRYAGEEKGFSLYECVDTVQACEVSYTLLKEEEDKKLYEIEISDEVQGNDCFLRIHFGGDTAKLYVEDSLVGDWFYTGQIWEIGLKRYGFPRKVKIEITALYKDAPRFLETWPECKDGIACELYNAEAVIEKGYHIKK
ncbi:hypothetical protein acsn021_36450 [Anaerocolumna cellulosilytica]|uniref:Uncharacterized protein n=1 Tax=Anaerocolumna cellulosilytica TaxID=433286 RepID=A0A6S6R1U6_9FIRM|nr:beta-galactosidase [Anaerocolumna cellulosilytica]MBB5195087.1 hypothetical protein [Anaerocolumna cellulosilytica]BCJ96076.1 hypothetical protein acsn021_36450 [Anaerocolumna cellulosilytica]